MSSTTASGIFAFAVFFCPEGIQRLFLRITCFFAVLRIKVPIRIYPCHIIHGRCNGCFYSCIQCSCVKIYSTPATDSNDSYFSFLYSSSLTGSSHSFELFSPGTSIARCENHSLISCFVPQFSSLPCLNCIVLLFDYTQLQFKMISICFYKALFL